MNPGIRSETVEKFLRAVLLAHYELTEEDVRDEENLSQIQMTEMLARQSAVYYQRPSERSRKVEEWKKKWEKACTAFRAFTECALLRSWEYTIASFCDIKTDFTRWNLYIGLGLHPDQKGGVGEFLYNEINALLQKTNREIERLTKEYEVQVGIVHAIETAIRGALSDVRRNQLKSEWVAARLSLNQILELRNREVAKGERFSPFFSSLLQQYDQKLQLDFQELFDPSLLGDAAHLYDDSPAGFRLVYKHGRADASLWTRIENGEQYIDCLRDFFSKVEGDLLVISEEERELVSKLTTSLIQFIQRPEFLNSSRQRAEEKGRRSPWAYISGGTLQTLLMAYGGSEKFPLEMQITPHSEKELLEFLMNIKEEGPLLMHSPTHAFNFYPEWLPKTFEAGAPKQTWDEAMQESIAHRISERLSQEEKVSFIHSFRRKGFASTNSEFRTFLIELLPPDIKNKGIIDSILYEQMPSFSQTRANAALKEILRELGITGSFPSLERSFLGWSDLYQMAKMMVLSTLPNAFSFVDWDLKIVKIMRQLQLAPTEPILFADTNWSGWFFGFISHPVTGELEFWRLNRNGTEGFPMLEWKEWINPTNCMPWGVVKNLFL